MRSVRTAKIPRFVAFLTLVSVCATAQVIAQEDESAPEPVGDVYEGPLVNGVREGFGKLTYADGSIYEGEFSNNLPSGSDATFLFADGKQYRGTFIDGEMQGYGTLEWPNGDVYVGTFNQNAITGSGTFFWQRSKVTYEGTMENGRRHGLGVMQWPDGRRYDGAFRLDERHGFGVFHTADGSSFRGFFEANRRHGDGVFEDRTGSKEFQRWNAGELVSRRPLAEIQRCRLEINDHAWMFESDECINGYAHGTGTAVRVDGLAYISNGTFIVGTMAVGVITSLAGEAAQ